MRARLALAFLLTICFHAGLLLVVIKHAVFPTRLGVGRDIVVVLWREGAVRPEVEAKSHAPVVETRKRLVPAPNILRSIMSAVPPSERTAPLREGNLTLGQIVSSGNQPPDYPEEARRRGWEGEVELRIWAGADGRVGRVDIVQPSGYPLLDRAALSAAESWNLGALASGHTFRVPVKFRLD